MGFERGFMEIRRVAVPMEGVSERVRHFNEFIATLSDESAIAQAGRCMDCGTPFCSHLCPLHNVMPEVNQAVCEGDFERAFAILETTSPFPEITGRICPALCEEACTLSLIDRAVGIKSVERKVADYALNHGLMRSRSLPVRTGKKVAIVGSGPAALACALDLNRLGHSVTVYEKNAALGGLLRLGIPDFKLSKSLLDRRLESMADEGVTFVTGTYVGSPEDTPDNGVRNDATRTVTPAYLKENFDAVVLCPGSEVPRDLPLEGRNLKGVHFALEFLIAQNLENAGLTQNPIDVRGKDVLVIGGGETASDCIGTARRKGALSITQVDYHDELPGSVDKRCAWPYYRHIRRTSTSQEEGCTRLFSTSTTAFLGDEDGAVRGISTVRVTWGPHRRITPVKGTEAELKGQVVLIALGYSHPSQTLLKAFNLTPDARGNIAAPAEGRSAFYTGEPGVFAAGDGRRGQSLVVYAFAEGKACAYEVNRYLNGD